ncbi:globin domain-containing protein [Streptomyces sp. NPDC050856]|uniref:globin domain-containing protein n=1 Tax=Streptomyces sp. NPDC050856 TaxID=3154939 RepID=UPI0033DD69CC
MDAPTTTSADNGTSGDSGGGGGWFTPRKPVTARATAADAAHRPAEEAARDEDRITGPRRPLTALRLVGAGTARDPEPAAPGAPAGTPAGPPASTATATAAEPVTEPVAGPADPDGEHPGPVSADERAQGERIQDEPAQDDRGGAGPVRTDRDGGAHSPVDHDPEPSPVEPWPVRPPVPGAAGDRQPVFEHRNTSVPPTAPRREPRAPHDADAPRSAVPRPGTTAPPQEPAGAQPRPGVRPGSPDAMLVRRTLAEIDPVSDKVTAYFYALLFVRHPELRALFPAAMDSQRDRLLKALLTAAEHMDDPAVLTDYLQHLGRGHRKYGTEAAHYPAVGEALIGSLSRYAANTWNDETEAAWVRTYTTISQIMIDAAAENERHAPAWWNAEVVSHDLRTPDIAVITVRPDQPYPFLAGQYTSLETPWWPRIWRHYSFASAPRSDGLLSFHVKAVPAGWVSNALVHHARPGDVLRLGPPAGSMTVDHTTDNGLLCLGGGTGIAPIKALVEDVAEHGARRPVEVFYGARTDHDLYDIDTMLRLQQSHPWLEVRAVIDGRTLPDVVREYGPWNEYDAYLSGPPGMIRSGVDALRGVGMPFERIRHDSLEELVAAAD